MSPARSWRTLALVVFPFLALTAISVLAARTLRIVSAYPRDPGGDAVVYWIVLCLAASSLFIYWPPPGSLREALEELRLVTPGRRSMGSLAARAPGVWAGLLLLTCAFAWMLLNYRLDGFYGTPDTDSYASVGQAALTSPTFLAGERPFTVPLAFRVFGITVQVLNDPSEYPLHARRFTQFESILSAFSFIALGVAAASHIKSRGLKSCVLFFVTAFGMTIDIALWNRMLLSESLSASLLCLLAALGLLAVHVWRRWERLPRSWRLAFLLLLGLVAVLYSFTRDVNAYLLLAVSAVLGVSLISRRVRQHPAVRGQIALAGFLFLVFLLQYSSMSIAGRWVVPLANVLHERFLTNEEGRSFLAAAGLPIRSLPAALISGECGEDCDEFHLLLMTDPGGRRLIEWIRLRGKGAYLHYLVEHPLRALAAPFEHVDPLLNGDSTEYRNRAYPDPTSAQFLREVLYPRSTPLVLIWTLAAVILLVRMIFARPARLQALIPLILIVGAYPLMFVVWHGDAEEVVRHAAQIGIQVRLGLWIGLVFALDFLWAGFLQLMLKRNLKGNGAGATG